MAHPTRWAAAAPVRHSASPETSFITPRRDWPVALLVVDDHVDAFIEEADPVAHGFGVVQRLVIRPGHVAWPAGYRVVRSPALVRAVGRSVAGFETHVYVLARQIEPHRQQGLEKQLRPVGFREQPAVQLDTDVSAAAQYVDAAERVMWVADHGFVLLTPLERGEFEDDVVGEVWVAGSERGGGAGLFAGDDVERGART